MIDPTSFGSIVFNFHMGSDQHPSVILAMHTYVHVYTQVVMVVHEVPGRKVEYSSSNGSP